MSAGFRKTSFVLVCGATLAALLFFMNKKPTEPQTVESAPSTRLKDPEPHVAAIPPIEPPVAEQQSVSADTSEDDDLANARPSARVLEDLKKYDEKYPAAIAVGNYEYAGALLMARACKNTSADPESDPNCLPLLRSSIEAEERVLSDEELARFYVAAESDSHLKQSAVQTIQRVNPQFFQKSEACFLWEVSSNLQDRDKSIRTCIKQVENLNAPGEAKTYFWRHYQYLMTQSPEAAEHFKNDKEFKSLVQTP